MKGKVWQEESWVGVRILLPSPAGQFLGVAAPSDPPTARPEYPPQAGPCGHTGEKAASWLLGEILIFVNKDRGGMQPGSSSPNLQMEKIKAPREETTWPRASLRAQTGIPRE